MYASLNFVQFKLGLILLRALLANKSETFAQLRLLQD